MGLAPFQGLPRLPRLGERSARVGSLSSVPLPPSEILRQIGEEQEPGALGRIGEWLGQPGYFVRNLLRGEPGKALKNVADLVSGTFTLYPLTGFNPFKITTREDRPEFSELVYGKRAARLGTGERLALDIGGGLLTDPLMFLSGGSLGALRGVLGVGSKLGKARGLVAALARTAAGSAAKAKEVGMLTRLTAEYGDDLARVSGLIKPAEALFGQTRQVLAKGVQALKGAPGETVTKYLRPDWLMKAKTAFAAKYGDELANTVSVAFRKTGKTRDLWLESKAAERIAEAVGGKAWYTEKGILPTLKALNAKGLVRGSGIRAGIPFTKIETAPFFGGRGPANLLELFWKGTAPGVAGSLMRRSELGRALLADVEKPVQNIVHTLTRKFFSKTAGITRQLIAAKIWAGMPRDEALALGARFDRTMADLARQHQQAEAATLLYRAGLKGLPPEADVALSRAFHDAESVFEQTRRAAGVTSVEGMDAQILARVPKIRELFLKRGIEEVKKALPAVEPDDIAAMVRKAADDWSREATAIYKEKVALKMFEGSGIPPDLYLPFQWSPAFFHAMQEGAGNAKFVDEMTALAGQFKTKFELTREFRTIQEFEDALRNVALKHGIDVDDLKLVNESFTDLTSRAMLVHKSAAARVRFMRRIAGLQEGAIEGAWADAVLKGLGKTPKPGPGPSLHVQPMPMGAPGVPAPPLVPFGGPRPMAAPKSAFAGAAFTSPAIVPAVTQRARAAIHGAMNVVKKAVESGGAPNKKALARYLEQDFKTAVGELLAAMRGGGAVFEDVAESTLRSATGRVNDALRGLLVGSRKTKMPEGAIENAVQELRSAVEAIDSLAERTIAKAIPVRSAIEGQVNALVGAGRIKAHEGEAAKAALELVHPAWLEGLSEARMVGQIDEWARQLVTQQILPDIRGLYLPGAVQVGAERAWEGYRYLYRAGAKGAVAARGPLQPRILLTSLAQQSEPLFVESVLHEAVHHTWFTALAPEEHAVVSKLWSAMRAAGKTQTPNVEEFWVETLVEFAKRNRLPETLPALFGEHKATAGFIARAWEAIKRFFARLFSSQKGTTLEEELARLDPLIKRVMPEPATLKALREGKKVGRLAARELGGRPLFPGFEVGAEAPRVYPLKPPPPRLPEPEILRFMRAKRPPMPQEIVDAVKAQNLAALESALSRLPENAPDDVVAAASEAFIAAKGTKDIPANWDEALAALGREEVRRAEGVLSLEGPARGAGEEAVRIETGTPVGELRKRPMPSPKTFKEELQALATSGGEPAALGRIKEIVSAVGPGTPTPVLRSLEALLLPRTSGRVAEGYILGKGRRLSAAGIAEIAEARDQVQFLLQSRGAVPKTVPAKAVVRATVEKAKTFPFARFGGQAPKPVEPAVPLGPALPPIFSTAAKPVWAQAAAEEVSALEARLGEYMDSLATGGAKKGAVVLANELGVNVNTVSRYLKRVSDRRSPPLALSPEVAPELSAPLMHYPEAIRDAFAEGFTGHPLAATSEFERLADTLGALRASVPGGKAPEVEMLARTIEEARRRATAPLLPPLAPPGGPPRGPAGLLPPGRTGGPISGPLMPADWRKVTFADPDIQTAVRQLFEPRKGRSPLEKVAHYLNAHFIKPGLTVGLVVPNPAFHWRNVISGAIMAAMDEDIGLRGFRILAGLLIPGSYKGIPGKLAAAARGEVKALAAISKVKVGRYSGPEVVEMLHAFPVAQDHFAAVELWGSMTTKRGFEQFRAALAGKVPEGAQGAWKEALKYITENTFPAKWANASEEYMRTSTFLALIEKDIHPLEAWRRTGEIMVSYEFQSGADRMLREVFPFARFTIAQFPRMIAKLGERPAWFIAPTIAGRKPPEGEVKPSWMGTHTPVFLGKDRQGARLAVYEFGLVQEQLNLLGLNAFGPLRSALAMLHPFVRVPLELATNRDFHFGGEAGEYDRAPRWLTGVGGLGLVRTEYTKAGKKIETVPRGFHAAMSLIPISRLMGSVDKILDERKDLVYRVLNITTGIKIASIDQEREVKKIMADYFKKKFAEGDVGALDVFYAKGEADPELTVLLQDYRARTKTKKVGVR